MRPSPKTPARQEPAIASSPYAAHRKIATVLQWVIVVCGAIGTLLMPAFILAGPEHVRSSDIILALTYAIASPISAAVSWMVLAGIMALFDLADAAGDHSTLLQTVARNTRASGAAS